MERGGYAPDAERDALAADGRELALTDAQIERKRKLVDLEGKETEVDKLKEELETEKENRGLRHRIAIAALIVMCVQVLASNAIFVWYGDTNGWERKGS